MNISKQRESSIELLRLIAQFMIVYYHILLFLEQTVDNTCIKAFQIPIHIGVPLFVIISGYFGIKPSVRGLFKLVSAMFIYTVPILLMTGKMGGVRDLLFISNSPYWFMRTYLYLYLFAPVINKYLAGITINNRLYLLLILSFMAIYISTFSSKDLSVWGGKNLVNFLLMYVVGDCLRCTKQYWVHIKTLPLALCYLSFNVLLVSGYMAFNDNVIGHGIWILSYSYYGPITYINAILLFMIVGKFSIQSKVINVFARSVLAIYLIHCSPALQEIRSDIALHVYTACNSVILFLMANCIFSLLIIFLSILIDNLLRPIWMLLDKVCVVLNKHYEIIFKSL